MSEVVEKKKLELNEKVDFSLAPVSEAGDDCIIQSTGTRPHKDEAFKRPEHNAVVKDILFSSMKQQRVEYRPSGSNAMPRASSYLSVNWGVWEPAKER